MPAEPPGSDIGAIGNPNQPDSGHRDAGEMQQKAPIRRRKVLDGGQKMARSMGVRRFFAGRSKSPSHSHGHAATQSGGGIAANHGMLSIFCQAKWKEAKSDTAAGLLNCMLLEWNNRLEAMVKADKTRDSMVKQGWLQMQGDKPHWTYLGSGATQDGSASRPGISRGDFAMGHGTQADGHA